MLMTSDAGTPSRSEMVWTFSGDRSPSSSARSSPFSLRRLKNSFFCCAVVPRRTSDHDCRMYSWMAARIHHMA